jgi:site-specific DNA recombinase
MYYNMPPVRPRKGHTLVVGVVARISGRPNQKELSLDDQEDHAKQVVAELWDGPVDFRVIATKGKGERLDRPELVQVQKMLRSRELDLLVAEDIGRIVRGAAAAWLCGIAVDCGTRVIAPNDCIDTIEDSWEEDVISACRDHVGHNAHTSKRLKQKLMNRFNKFGGAMAREIYGYIVPDDAKTYDDWAKDEAATPIYRDWFERLRQVPNCSLLADWLNVKGVPTGPYSRNKKWDGRMVRRVTRNPVLKGMPGRGFMHTIKHHETGRRVSVKNPSGPKYKEYPQLAHVESALWDEVDALLKKTNHGRGRKMVNGADPRAGVSRKRTIWPGRRVRCGICNRLYYWGGHGQNDHMMCSGCRDYRCWNGVTFDGHEAAYLLIQAVFHKIEALTDFDPVFFEKVKTRMEQRCSRRTGELSQAQEELKTILSQQTNVSDAIAEIGLNDVLHQKLNRLTARCQELQARITRLKQEPADDFILPTMIEIKKQAKESLEGFGPDQPEFGRLMRRLVPYLYVFPYRSCDGGGIVLRAKLTLDLTTLVPLSDLGDEAEKVLRHGLIVDLFKPPQRVAFREQVVRLRAEGMKEARVAHTLGITVAAAQKAAALHRLMQNQGLVDPYLPITELPGDCTKLKRHLHPRYHFEPFSLDERP